MGILLGAATFNADAALTSYTGAGGVGLVYSSWNNLTWTKDANLFKTMYDANHNLVNLITAITPTYNDQPEWFYGLQEIGDGGAIDDFDTDTGRPTWWGAIAFTNYLNSINYGGSNKWALPGSGIDPEKNSYNEQNPAYFINEQASSYWSGQTHGTLGYVWSFNVDLPYDWGTHYRAAKTARLYTWAVTKGIISQAPAAVPVPAAAWLMGSALLGFIGLKRGKRQA